MPYDFSYGGLTYCDDWHVDFWFKEDAVGCDLREWVLTFGRDEHRFWGNLLMSENIDTEFGEYRSLTREEIEQMTALLPLEWKLRLALFNNLTR